VRFSPFLLLRGFVSAALFFCKSNSFSATINTDRLSFGRSTPAYLSSIAGSLPRNKMATEAASSSEEGPSAMAVGPPTDVEQVRAYMLRVLPVLLEEDVLPDMSTLESAVKAADSQLKKFAEDPQERALLVLRTLPPETEEEEGEGASTGGATSFRPAYEVQLGLNYKPTRCIGVAFIKRGAILEADKSVRLQLRVMNFSEDSPFETLHSYVRDAVTPYFNSYIQSTKKATEGDKLVPSVQKKMNELEVGLLHLQQNIDIPEISLTIHSTIVTTVKKAAESGKKLSVEELGPLVSDSSFLNALQKDVSRWIREIQKVTRLERDASSGTALQETSFWMNLEHALSKIHSRRHSPEVQLTLDVLKAGKRFHATVSFDADTGLKEAQDKVNDYSPLMKDFPVNELLAAGTLETIKLAVAAVYTHLRKIRTTSYPAQRAIYLVEAISRDLSTQLLKVLGMYKLMLVTYEEFEQVMGQCFSVFNTWDEEYDKFTSQLREMSKKKREETLKFSWRANSAHKRLQERITKMRDFRKQHEQLQAVIVRVLRSRQQKGQPTQSGEGALETDDQSAVREVKLAYENVKVVDCLDLTPEGSAAWEAALKRYDERIDRVETRIAARLRDQLGTAKNANEMFRIFSRYNALFVRAHIRGAIREYQAQLIQRVKDDIEKLHQKFKMQYNKTMTHQMCVQCDYPPVSSAIIWARQIDRQLQTYLQRVEAVLGKGWENHVEGQKLKQDGDSFRQKLNTQQLFDDWKKKVEARQLVVQGRIFNIVSQRTRTGTILKLQVNFTPETITLAKEVRNFKWLNFRVPFSIVNQANQANQLYPHAVSLMESIRTYELMCTKISDKKGASALVAHLKIDVQELVREGCQLLWESYKLEGFVQKFSECIFSFQERVDEVLLYSHQIDELVGSLETCEYRQPKFREVLDKLQKMIDDLNLRSYSNLRQWVAELDRQVEARLMRRLAIAIRSWQDCLRGVTGDSAVDTMDTTTSTPQLPHELGGTPALQAIQHELHITNQIMHLQPPVEMARCDLIAQLHNWVSIVTALPRIQSSRYQVGLVELSPMEATYRSLLGKLMEHDSEPLVEAYGAIEELLSSVQSYVKVWLQYQSLWDMEPANIYSRLESDLTKWQKLLMDIKKSRKTVDTTETMKQFGPVEIHYGKVQQKVNLKYDSWHREILSRFGSLLGDNMQDFHCTVAKYRTDLESHVVDAATTSEAVGFITLMQELKRKMRSWEQQVEVFRAGEKILDRQRFQFPSSWVYVDNVEGEWGAFNEIVKRKESSVQTQIGTLQMQIVAEDRAVEQKTAELLQLWEKEKPVQGELRPDDAANLLTIFEGKFTRIKEDRDNVIKAKEALELAEPGLVSGSDERVVVALEELIDLKGVWSELSKVWEKIEEMREKPWLSVAPRKIRQGLDVLVQQLRGFPARLKSYASFEYVQATLKGYMKVNVLVTELKSEALKERHWKQLMKKLRVSWQLHDLTLGQVWGVDLQRNEMIVKDVILVAQGEMALEEFLKQVREAWQTYELEMINYQNKCRIIRGWDDLFTKCKEHLNSVAAMKLSPYYKVFEDDALQWEERLNRINTLFDVWIDVQRRWVYLEGIFTGSADIKHLLPNETQRFQSISSEFLSLMKKVAKSPLVMDVLNIPGVQKSLERLADLLGKIQKALGEYLERERASFPRFYFVGDEDLLEIIGNSKNVPRLQKHFKKMFAGVHSVLLSDDQTKVLGISAKEGEQVVFKTPVSIADNPKINQWLSLVEKEMRLNLAMLLAQAVDGIAKFSKGTINTEQYLQWVDSYQAQLVVLASQVTWSTNVESALQTLQAQASPGELAPMNEVLGVIEGTLNVLADCVLHEQPPVRRKKLEHLITELVHQRDTTRMLITNKVAHTRRFEWLSQMRFYFDPKKSDVLQQLSIHMANAHFNYGFEYLGVQDRLVQTPLTDRCYLTMTQALEERLGGSPFGPAGTGKTESVKALGHQLGRFVLVFNCDEKFDFQAMGRIFVGLCQVGAWGCFDEFNRLEERMLSAVSQQIQTIQEALKEQGQTTNTAGKTIAVEIVGKQVRVNPDMAIFITMNPGYAGRSNLPDNLKQLFRSLAMTKPDRQLIAQVMLYSQGFRTAEVLASKIVPFFKLCDEQLSSQSHYDFGLRALKSVLVSAGNIKRETLMAIKRQKESGDVPEEINEQEILIQSVCETVVPKLVAEDIPLLHSLLADVFPGVKYRSADVGQLKAEIAKVCAEMHLVCGDSDTTAAQWLEKVPYPLLSGSSFTLPSPR
jgi:dynein heavy chain 1